ncbi:MAG TPA: hypothetical protein VMW44_01340 [Candidatus Bathyarchaeia archaeon]|nr:hypothetical protein [Candidatus Bathyarchaeia archaeon]
MKVRRVIEYEGPKDWIDACLYRSIKKLDKELGQGKCIKEISVEIIEPEKEKNNGR